MCTRDARSDAPSVRQSGFPPPIFKMEKAERMKKLCA